MFETTDINKKPYYWPEDLSVEYNMALSNAERTTKRWKALFYGSLVLNFALLIAINLLAVKLC